jgi:hypothetical protein
MEFNLDRAHPIAQLPTTHGRLFGKPYFSKATITLAHGEQQQIQLNASTRKYDCAFRIDMAVLDGTHIVHETIGNGKQPFRVTAAITNSDPLQAFNYSAYQRLYIGGVASATVGCNDKWVQVNPLTYSDVSTTPISGC